YFRAFGDGWVLCSDQSAGMALGAALALEGSSQPSALAALLPPAFSEEVWGAFAAFGHDVFRGNHVTVAGAAGLTALREMSAQCGSLARGGLLLQPRGALIDHVAIRCLSVVGWWHGVFFGGDASFVGG
ncbi:unnamed protein product, partial [Prorocentrum cordatum]